MSALHSEPNLQKKDTVYVYGRPCSIYFRYILQNITKNRHKIIRSRDKLSPISSLALQQKLKMYKAAALNLDKL